MIDFRHFLDFSAILRDFDPLELPVTITYDTNSMSSQSKNAEKLTFFESFTVYHWVLMILADCVAILRGWRQVLLRLSLRLSIWAFFYFFN